MNMMAVTGHHVRLRSSDVRAEPLQNQLRVAAEVIVALEALVGSFDPEELLVLRGDRVVDLLHI